MGSSEMPPKSEWGPGPWQDEPDLKEWEYAGYKCFAKRSEMGSWCGYVGVGVNHPYYAKEYTWCVEGCGEQDPEDRWRSMAAIGDGQFSKERWGPRAVAIFARLDKFRCEIFSHHVEDKLEVHGGITYSGPGWSVDEHWYFGFDCAHSGDLMPATETLLRQLRVKDKAAWEVMTDEDKERTPWFKRPPFDRVSGMHDTYRTLEYVVAECEALAEQLKEVEEKRERESISVGGQSGKD